MDTTNNKNTSTEKNTKQTAGAEPVSQATNSTLTSASDLKNSKKSYSAEGKTAQKPSETSKEGPLYKFFLDALKDIYFAEKHILDALPKMRDAATTEELKDAFEDHYLMTQKQASRLEKVFKSIDEKPETKKCDAIIGIVKEGESIIKETEEGTMTRDAALIIAAQKVEHYEIASYGGLVALAETMKLYTAADLLHTTLDEEEDTDHDLTEIAETYINFGAADEDEEEGDDWEDEEDEDY